MIRQHPPRSAILSCVPCRQGKRKCDKQLPECALCKRIGKRCHYPPAPVKAVSPPSRSVHIFDPEQYSIASVHRNLKEQLLSIIGDDIKVQCTSIQYLNTIHTWFPILSSANDPANAQRIFEDENPEFALLATCMLLLVTVPEKDGLSKWMKAVHMVVKGALVLLSGERSIVFLQAKLLLALFEVGHGITSASFVTVGSIAREVVVFRNMDGSEKDASEVELVWRGVLILERYVAIDIGDSPCVTKGLAGRAGQNLPSTTANCGISNDFNKLSEAVDLLAKVLLHVHDPTPHQEFNWDEAVQLMTTLISFSTILKQEAENSRASAVAISTSSIMVLCDFGNRSGLHVAGQAGTECERGAIVFLEGLVQEVASIARRIEDKDLQTLPPFLAHSIYKATSILSINLKESTGIDHVGIMNALRNGLLLISQRWRTAGRYLELLTEIS